MTAYYNEIDPTAAHVLECLIKDGVIAPGVVDRRSIADVEPSDVKEFRQAHFFAGGGIWSVAARLAGWPDDRQLWTGSCPCQPFSVAGKGAGENDPRHLWPHFFRLIRSCRPPVVVGEQVAGKAGYGWFDGVRSDLEGENYASRAVDIPACAINAPHIRQRLYWIAQNLGNTNGAGRDTREQTSEAVGHGSPAVTGSDSCVSVADANGSRSETWLSASSPRRERHTEIFDNGSGGQFGVGQERMADADGGGCGRGQEIQERSPEQRIVAERPSFWHDTEWLAGTDGKTRRIKPGIRLLSYGLPGRVGLLRIGGNAIVAPLAAEVLRALLETENA